MSETLPLPGRFVEDPQCQANWETIQRQWPGSGPPGALVAVGSGGTAPAFKNAWVNFGGGATAASYYIDRGRVYLVGLIKSGTIAQAAFTLPVGPPTPVNFAVDSNGAFGTVQVDAAGNVVPTAGSNVFVDLAPISFRVA